uniref:glucuronosyltransferase n=1 Tax=Bubo bubo TaxID=30461 RepID=A0A8C0FP32_BUBBB
MAPVLSAHPQVTTTLVLLLSMLSLAAGGKLLVVPVDGSHWLSMREVLDVLSQKGHEINFVMKTYPIPFTKEEVHEAFWRTSQDVFEEGPFLERFLKTYERVKNISAMYLSTCAHLLYNKELVRYLEESKFDAVFTDPILPCGQILAEHLSVPSVVFLQQMPCGLEFEATQCPNPSSYVPRTFTDLTDRMNFFQRVKNLIFNIPNYFLCDFVFQPYAKLASEFLQRDVTVQDLLRQVSIWLIKLDFVLHYPRPLMPNMIMVSGVNYFHLRRPLLILWSTLLLLISSTFLSLFL